LIVGLGNPGPRYAGTRHNVGFMVAVRCAERWSIDVKHLLCRSKFGEGTVHGEPVRLAMPQTLMNASGEGVGCLLKRWRLDHSQMLVVCDDVSLPLGMIRLRSKGSDGGHNGLASILQQVQTDQVARLRIGIQTRPQAAGEDLTPFVLGRFSPAERKRVKESVEVAVEACEVWMTRGVSAAMNLFNRRIECHA